MYDLILKNGLIVDGTGAPGFVGDVAVRDGKIARIAKCIDESAKETIDVSGLVVSPGFIESHTHSDPRVFIGTDSVNFLEQGSTTQIAGNCGSHPAPFYDGAMQSNRNRTPPEEFAKWIEKAKTPTSFMAAAKEQTYGTNFAFLMGHGALRGNVMGYTPGKANEEQLAKMKAYLQEAMEAGYLGMSTGLVYAPSVYADADEIAEIASVMAPYGGIYASHIRGEADTVEEAVDEAITIGKKAGVPVHISHLKVMGKHNEGKSAALLQKIDDANAAGHQVTADQYPFNASAATMSSQIPPKYLVGGKAVWLKKLEDPEIRKQINYSIFHETEEFSSGIYTAGWDGAMITRPLHTHQYANMTIGEIAKAEGKEPIDVYCDLLIANEGDMAGMYFNQNGSDILRIMAHPKVFCGSDNSDYQGERPDPETKGGFHPRALASMPRRLELCRDFRLRSLEDSIHSITGAPAKIFGLKDRGELKEGNPADITVFDYSRVHANATYEYPYRRNDGIEYVFVNGQLALKHGVTTGVRAGQILTRNN